MPPDALPAKAIEIVPVGAIDNRCELRMPDSRICALIASGRRDAACGSARYWLASNNSNGPRSTASAIDASYALSRITSAMRADTRRASSVS